MDYPGILYISVNPKFTYVWVHNKNADEYYLMSKELAPAAMADCKIEDYEFVGREMLGAEWDLATFHHPLAIYNRTIYVLEGNHVTLDAGTGCVHTAPGHGVEDFEVYKSYENAGKLKQEVVCPVDEKGNMTAEAGEFSRARASGTQKARSSPLWLMKATSLARNPSTISTHTAGAARTQSSIVLPSSGSHPSTTSEIKH